uniref:RNA-directed DNA polymerase n=1 Tax=Ixodes ricinus TaxID=34613 RepID=A0A147BJ81_IXORI
MGPKAREILSSLQVEEANFSEFKHIAEKFDGYFIHPANELYERARFHRRVQQAGESADSFFTVLGNFVKKCNYPSREVEERLIRDRFVVGLRDVKLSDRLCRNPRLTLEEALIQVRQAEDAERERRTRDSTGASAASAEAKAISIDAARVTGNRPPKTARNVAVGNAGSSPCGFCGRNFHPRSECAAGRAFCSKCHKKGHFAAVCRSGTKLERHSKRLASVELGAVSSDGSTRAKFVEVKVDGMPLSFKVDSGAEVTVIPSTFSGIPARLEPPDGQLTGPAGQPLDVLGAFVATLEWKNRTTKQKLYVVRSQVVPLLGFPGIQALGVVKFVEPVAAVQQGRNNPSPTRLFQGLGELKEEYIIRLQPDAIPFSLHVPRRVPIPLRDVVKTELDKMEAQGVIRRVSNPTPWCAGMVVVPKPSGAYRICVDLTRLNKVVLRECHILPTVDQVLGLLGEARVFSKLDATSSFHQVKLAEDSQELTTFITPFGRYCFRRLPFGITSAPEFFQRQMSYILEGQDGVVNMIDDVLVFGRDSAEHDRRLAEVLDRLARAGLTLNKAKCKFGVTSVGFLGVIVSGSGISPDPQKVAAVQRMEPPVDVGGVRRILGMVNHVGRFLPHLSDVTAPIRELLNKRSVWLWGPSQQAAFQRLKDMISSDVCMANYHPQHPTIISADSSSFGLGAVLLQDQPTGERRAVAFASRALTPTEQRYSQTEKEALAVVWAVQRFDEYVRGLQFTVETDHQPLTALLGEMDVDVLPPRIQRLRIKLMRYQYRIFYVPGKLLATADTLSRAPLTAAVEASSVELYVQNVVHSIQEGSPVSPEDVRRHQASDGECVTLEKFCNHGWPQRNKLPSHVMKYWNFRGELSVCDGLLLKGGRLVIPSALQPKVLQLIHEGHQGVNRCKVRARDSVWWPQVGQQIEAMVQACERCASTRTQRAEPLLPTPPVDLP